MGHQMNAGGVELHFGYFEAESSIKDVMEVCILV